MIKSLRSPQNETVCLFRSRGQGKKFQEHTVCTKEINFGGKANGNGVDPSGVNRELSSSSKTQSTVHIWERTWTSQFCFPSSQPQACSLLRLFHCSDLLQLQGLKLSCFSSPQCNVFVFIFHRYLPYLHRCKSHFLNLLFTLWLWVSWFLSSLPPYYGSLAFTCFIYQYLSGRFKVGSYLKSANFYLLVTHAETHHKLILLSAFSF